LTEGCIFKPDLSMTRSGISTSQENLVPDGFFKRTMEWKTQNSSRKEMLRLEDEERKLSNPDLTFKPVIKEAIPERLLTDAD
jgi:hypothetical protein